MHWMLLRGMAAPGPDDMFLAGDTHQRIYDSYVSLGSLGIAIRGRSTRLTLSYRSTHEILTIAEGLLGREERDDLDGGSDSLQGYRSVLRGPRRNSVPPPVGRTSWPGYDPLRYQREIKQARSLLFVAVTRARDSLIISWHGRPSPFLPTVPPA